MDVCDGKVAELMRIFAKIFVLNVIVWKNKE